MSELLDWLFPRVCVACESVLRGSGGRFGLCEPCVARLVPPARSACLRCGEPVAAGRICAPCAVDPPPFERLDHLWSYEPPVRELVHAFKFRRLDYLGEALGEALGEHLAGALSASQRPALVVPMPLAWTRRLSRGYNQAEILAAAVAKRLALPSRALLARRLSLAHQTGRGRRERLGARHSAAGAFAIGKRSAAAAAGRRLLLIDDVVTTGATARAAAAALLAAGAAAVHLAVVARTPRRGS